MNTVARSVEILRRCAARFQINIAEIGRFVLVGVANTVLAYGVYSLALYLGTPYYLALVFDYAFAILFSLIANGLFTFRLRERLRPSTLGRMAFSYGIMFMLNEGLLRILVGEIHLNPYVSQAVVSVVIAGTSYLLQRNLVFRVGKHGTDR